jgi:hypothetical protein
MKHKMDRVLRIRTVLEDVSRLDFEKKRADMRYLEMAADRQRRLALVTRADALRMLAEGESVERESWLMRIADAEILGWKEAGLEALANAWAPVVREAHEGLVACRIDRSQLEVLLSAAARSEEKAEICREQNRIDDLFQSQSTRKNRRRK